MLPMADGKLKESHTRKKMELNSTGSAQECSGAEPITGEGYRCVSVQRTLNIEALMDLATTGRLVMMTLLLIMIKLISLLVYSDQKKIYRMILIVSSFLRRNRDCMRCL